MMRIFLATIVLAFAVVAPSAAAEGPVFEKDVLPIFTKYCFNCHGKSSPQLGLDLRTARLAMRGSQNGAVIVPGSPEKSLLWRKVSTREMPLAQFKLKLSDAEIETIRKWIEGGAHAEPVKLPADVQAQFARFEKEIGPILTQRCVSCHGEDEPEAELDLRSLESLVRGSKSGPVIVEGFQTRAC
jgi:mono/diheme cytochrome c family protein